MNLNLQPVVSCSSVTDLGTEYLTPVNVEGSKETSQLLNTFRYPRHDRLRDVSTTVLIPIYTAKTLPRVFRSEVVCGFSDNLMRLPSYTFSLRLIIVGTSLCGTFHQQPEHRCLLFFQEADLDGDLSRRSEIDLSDCLFVKDRLRVEEREGLTLRHTKTQVLVRYLYYTCQPYSSVEVTFLSYSLTRDFGSYLPRGPN